MSDEKKTKLELLQERREALRVEEAQAEEAQAEIDFAALVDLE